MAEKESASNNSEVIVYIYTLYNVHNSAQDKILQGIEQAKPVNASLSANSFSLPL